MSSCKFCGRELDYDCGQCPDHSAPYNCAGSRPGSCYQREIDALRAEVARLEAKLARYEGPLTDEQLSSLVNSLGAGSIAWGHRDAAIRKVRGEP